MKLSYIALLSMTGTCYSHFVPVSLDPPDNWVAGSRLFPANVIAGHHADYDKYTAQSWAEFINKECEKYSACTSTNSYAAINSGNKPKCLLWFGYCYGGGPTTLEDYVRDLDPKSAVQDSKAFTVSYNSE